LKEGRTIPWLVKYAFGLRTTFRKSCRPPLRSPLFQATGTFPWLRSESSP